MLGRVFVFSCGSVRLSVAEKPDTNTRHLFFFSPRYRGRNLVTLLKSQLTVRVLVLVAFLGPNLLVRWGEAWSSHVVSPE